MIFELISELRNGRRFFCCSTFVLILIQDIRWCLKKFRLQSTGTVSDDPVRYRTGSYGTYVYSKEGSVHKLEPLVMRRKLGLPFCLDTNYPRSTKQQTVRYVPVRYGVLLVSQIEFWDLQFILWTILLSLPYPAQYSTVYTHNNYLTTRLPNCFLFISAIRNTNESFLDVNGIQRNCKTNLNTVHASDTVISQFVISQNIFNSQPLGNPS
jgi:hypothetical protein